MPQKTTAIYDMAMELKEKGLIDGIGMQSHLDVGFPNASTYENALSKFASTGLDIQITELDITTSDTSEAGLEKQAQMYSDIFDLCVKYKDNISAVVIWGVTDDQSWRATRVPLLFDENFKAKPAFYAIVDDVEPLDPITTTVTTTSSETTTTTTTEPDGNFIPGDVNFDKVVNGFDLSAMRQEWVGEAQYAPYLDMNQDGSFNAADVVALAKFLLGE